MSLVRAASAAAVVLALAGCDYPTSAPILDQSWILPAENTTIDVGQLLPSGISDNGSTFLLTVDSISSGTTLGALCSPCQAFNGFMAPKPAFTGTFTGSGSLPVDVASVTLVSGSVEIALRNGFSFDPIRPGAGNTGTLSLVLTDGQGGRQLGALVLNGATDSLPPGSTTIRTVTLEPGAVGTTIVTTVTIDSPAGDPTTIDASQQLTAVATPSSLLVSSASVNVQGRGVNLDTTSLDVGNIDQTFVNHITQGGFTLDITNPFGVSVTGTLQVTGNGFSPIPKSFTVSADPTSTTSVSFTTDELRQFLGKSNVEVIGSGVASAPGPVTMTPGQRITVDTKLGVSLSFGG